MTHPDLESPRVAKRAALALARAINADVVQSPDGKTKTVFLPGGKKVPCVTWLAAYGVVHRIRLDQIGRKL